MEGQPNIVDCLKNNGIVMVMNITEGTQAVSDSREIRRVARIDNIPYFTTAAASIAVVAAVKARGMGCARCRREDSSIIHIFLRLSQAGK